jgi:hypothetical protein
MTTHLPLPSTQIAEEATKPRMRFLYPLAAVCMAAVFLAPTSGEAQPGGAIKLRPDQQRAIELGAAKRRTCHALHGATSSLPQALRMMSEVQIAMMIAQMQANVSPPDSEPEPEPEPGACRRCGRNARGPRLHDRAQYEPLIRKHHAVQTRVRQAGRQRQARGLLPDRPRSVCAVSAPAGAMSSASSRCRSGPRRPTMSKPTCNGRGRGLHAPQDGRYKFDFSKVRTSFDEKAAVEAAIKDMACDQVHAAGKCISSRKSIR